jgi:hypothetical protein
VVQVGLGAVAAVAALLSGTAHAQAVAEFARGRVLAIGKAGLGDDHAARIAKEAGARNARRIGRSDIRIIELPEGASEQAFIERLSRNPHFKQVELDHRVSKAVVANDPYAGSQWHLTKINSSLAWEQTQGAGVTVAILDSGVDGSHPDLAGRVVAGWNFVDNNSNTADVHGHGTAVAGAALATLNNGIGVASVAGAAKLMPVRIADANAYAYWSTVAQGLYWAADNGARVANISYVGVAASATVQTAAQYFKNKGGLVVVCAGNNNRDEGFAQTSTMIPVSATDSNDAKASFSSWGQFVAMSAPGVSVWTTTRGGGYQQWWGTSIASPVTAGVVALMMARNPALNAPQIESLLFSSAVDLGAAGRDPVYGHGRVNAAAAVSAAATAVSTADTQAPVASIVAPLANSTVTGLVAVSADASDNIGVARVELRVNGQTVATDTQAPFGFSWDSTKVGNGTSTLVAVAFDAAGNSSASAPVSVNVANTAAADSTPPALTIVNPTSGAVVSGTVKIQLRATDNAGTAGIRQTLFIDNKQVASSAGGALDYSWNTRKIAAGGHSIRAVAQDAAGNTSSQTISVTR